MVGAAGRPGLVPGSSVVYQRATGPVEAARLCCPRRVSRHELGPTQAPPYSTVRQRPAGRGRAREVAVDIWHVTDSHQRIIEMSALDSSFLQSGCLLKGALRGRTRSFPLAVLLQGYSLR